MNAKEEAFKLRRHDRKRKMDQIVTSIFIGANLLGIPYVYRGIDAVLRQGCSRDLLCEMTPNDRRTAKFQTESDFRLADRSLFVAGALVTGNITYYLAQSKKK